MSSLFINPKKNCNIDFDFINNLYLYTNHHRLPIEKFDENTHKKYYLDSITSSNIDNFIKELCIKKIESYFFKIKLTHGDLLILKNKSEHEYFCVYFRNNNFEINNNHKQEILINITRNVPNYTLEWNNFNKVQKENVNIIDIVLSQPNDEEDYNKNNRNTNNNISSFKTPSIWDCYM